MWLLDAAGLYFWNQRLCVGKKGGAGAASSELMTAGSI